MYSMADGITNQYIENAIKELDNFFGIKEPFSEENIYPLIESKRIKDGLRLISHQLGLPIDINITNVPKNYKEQNQNNRFHSTYVVKTDRNGSGNEGITAQAIIPGDLPPYGTSALNNYPINIKISENCDKYPTTFTMIIAHELTHVLLYSLNHPQKDNEIYTDLNAMMQGFYKIFRDGRKITDIERITSFAGTTTETTTTTFGYLSDEQFKFAFNKIEKLLEEKRERKKLLEEEINKTSRLLKEYEDALSSFNNYLNYLTKNTHIKISGEDGKKMVMFFQPDYIEKLNFPINNCSEKQINAEKYLERITHYTTKTLKQITKYMEEFEYYRCTLKQKTFSIKTDNKTMKKYTTRLYRIKNFFIK
jgi:hypothetical protein